MNYLPKVRILCHSIRRYHPEAVIHLALADERPQWLRTEDEPFDSILGIERLGIPDYRNWTFTHSIVELSTAIKPFALKHLLQLPDCGTVLYFDPDMVLFSRVDDILATLETQQPRADAAPDEAGTDARRDLRQRGREPEARHLQPGLHRRAQHRRRPALRRLVGRAHLPSLLGGRGERPLHRPEVGELRADLLRRRGDHQVVAPQRRHVEPDDAPDDRQLRDRLRGRRRAARLLPFHRLRQRRAPHHGDQERVRRARRCRSSSRGTRARSRSRTAIPISEWPWAFGRFSDGTPIEPGHRRLYRDHSDLQKAFPEPYDAGNRPGRAISAGASPRGKLRYPELFARRRRAAGAEAGSA